MEDGKQVIRSSGSMGANYIEANEAVSKKDFLLRIKICRKEAKKSGYWLKLLDTNGNKNFEMIRLALEPEERELVNMFGSILRKTE